MYEFPQPAEAIASEQAFSRSGEDYGTLNGRDRHDSAKQGQRHDSAGHARSLDLVRSGGHQDGADRHWSFGQLYANHHPGTDETPGYGHPQGRVDLWGTLPRVELLPLFSRHGIELSVLGRTLLAGFYRLQTRYYELRNQFLPGERTFCLLAATVLAGIAVGLVILSTPIEWWSQLFAGVR